MGGGTLLALAVRFAGFCAANAFRWRRINRRSDRRREQRDLERRRHHYRGSLEMEADQGFPARPTQGPASAGPAAD